MSDFTTKTAWLVGASEGIGAALAPRLAAECGHVVISARNEEKLRLLAAQLPAGRVTVAALDITDTQSVRAAWEQMRQSDRIPDMVIYNAGTYAPMAATAFDLAKAEQMMDVNFHGALRVLSMVLPAFIARDSGHIALVGSVAGYRGLPGAIGYGASKAALIHLAENLKADLAATIKVQIINPGFVKTRLTDMNDFPMPCIISPEQAADFMMKGLKGDAFEIHFPKRFSLMLKFLSLLPNGLYFRLLHKRMARRG